MAEAHSINRVVVLIAMEAEAQPLVTALPLAKDVPSKLPGPFPCVSYSGRVENLEVIVVTAGKDKETSVDNVGTVPAALAAYIALSTLHPDLVINAGTAGGFQSDGSKIGDVYVSTECVNHDRRMIIPGFDVYGIGRKSSVPTNNLRKHLGLKSGVVSSGNSLDYTNQDMAIMKQNSVAVKDMEAAAIAWVAGLFRTPMFCIKAVTDIVDGNHPPESEFLENLSKASETLKSTMIDILYFVNNRTIASL